MSKEMPKPKNAPGCTSAAPVEGAQPTLYENDSWAVAPDGIECQQVMPNGRKMEYFIPKQRLLEQRGRPGISAWAQQLASKTWLEDIDHFVDALQVALRAHHPRQAVINIDETRRRAREAWAAMSARAASASASALLVDSGSDSIALAGDPADPPWIADELETTRMLLRRYGVPPHAHPKAAAFNYTVVGALHGLFGYRGDALDEKVESLRERVFRETSQDAPEEAPGRAPPGNDGG